VADRYGIYIWGVPRPDGLLVHYVGETSKAFKARHKNHLHRYHNGSYLRWVYDSKKFKNGHKQRIWDGPFQSGVEEFKSRSDELTPKITAFLNTMQIYLAPTRVDGLVRKRIESAIASNLKDQPFPGGDFIDDDRRYPGNPARDGKTIIMIQSPTMLIGLPESIFVWLPKT
jgi:hypothetical protein